MGCGIVLVQVAESFRSQFRSRFGPVVSHLSLESFRASQELAAKPAQPQKKPAVAKAPDKAIRNQNPKDA